MISLLRQIRIFFCGAKTSTIDSLFQEHSASFFCIQSLIRAFYGFLFFLAILKISEWDHFANRSELIPLWPIMWIEMISPSLKKLSVYGIMILYTFGSLAAAVAPRMGVFRIAAFLGVFLFIAYNYSFGKIGHSMHLMVLISFVFIFLPKGWDAKTLPSRSIRQQSLLTFWTAQAVIMLSYTMAGFIKILAGLYQVSQGQPSVFGTEALARHTAHRLFETNTQGYFSELVIQHTWISFFLMSFTLYIEFFALWAIFRPRLMWFFALSLIGFHIGSEFVMTIFFPPACFLLALLIAGSPLRKPDWTLRTFLEDLPLVSFLVKRIYRQLLDQKNGPKA